MKVGFVARDGSDLGYGELLPMQEGRDMRNAVHVADFEKIRSLGVDFVIFHRDLGGELRWRGGEPFADVTPWIASYRQLIGAPVHEDRDVVVFKVR